MQDLRHVRKIRRGIQEPDGRFSQEFIGIRPDTPIEQSACDGEGYSTTDSIIVSVSEIRAIERNLKALHDREQMRYLKLSDGEKLGETGWSFEEDMNDLLMAMDYLDKAATRLKGV